MTPFFILLGSWALFRILGWLGLRYLKDWDQAGATALAVTFGFTGVTHFSSMAGDYMAMIPPPLPQSIWVIYVTGGLELIGAVGLLSRRQRSQAGRCLIALLVVMFPANAYAALAGIPFRGEAPTPLAIRAAIQLGFILALWLVSRQTGSGRTLQSTEDV